jgi:hypothetical protein
MTAQIEYIEIDPDEEWEPATPFDEPDFVYRDVHPKHRPVWGGSVWQCTCGRYASDRLSSMQQHADWLAERDFDTDKTPMTDVRKRAAGDDDGNE